MLRSVGLIVAAALIAGCDDAVGPDSLSYEGVTTILSAKPMMLQTTVTVRNVSSRVVKMDRNICPTWYTAHSSAAREDSPVWEYPTPRSFVCAAWAGPLDLAPGDYYRFQTQVTVPATAANGIEFLTFHFALRDEVALPVGQVIVSDGTVSLP